MAQYDPFRIRFLSNCVSEPSILRLWEMREDEKEQEFKMIAALHGVRIEGEHAEVDKNEMNKKAAMQIFGMGGAIRRGKN